MICCDSQVQTFFDEEVTVAPYSAEDFGDTPKVEVFYLNDDGTYEVAGVFTEIRITATEVIVNHGGPASGFVKIW